MDQLQEENRLLISKSQQTQQQLNAMKGDRERSERQNETLRGELGQAQGEISRLEGRIDDL